MKRCHFLNFIGRLKENIGRFFKFIRPFTDFIRRISIFIRRFLVFMLCIFYFYSASDGNYMPFFINNSLVLIYKTQINTLKNIFLQIKNTYFQRKKKISFNSNK